MDCFASLAWMVSTHFRVQNGVHPSESLSTATRKATQKPIFRTSHHARNAGISLCSN
jgi:hypothetical protein